MRYTHLHSDSDLSLLNSLDNIDDINIFVLFSLKIILIDPKLVFN